MVLFLFVVMMLDINLVRLREGFGEYLPIGGIVAVLLVLEMALLLSASEFQAMPEPPSPAAGYSNTRELGRLLYTRYVYPLEIAAGILLVAIVAAIALTLRRRKDSKYQDPGRQIAIERKDRIRIVKMRAEKRT
jgi:NADH-quinone oxidoreductase subunit J